MAHLLKIRAKLKSTAGSTHFESDVANTARRRRQVAEGAVEEFKVVDVDVEVERDR